MAVLSTMGVGCAAGATGGLLVTMVVNRLQALRCLPKKPAAAAAAWPPALPLAPAAPPWNAAEPKATVWPGPTPPGDNSACAVNRDARGMSDEQTRANAASSAARFYALRLNPGDELKTSLLGFCEDHGLRAAAVVTCVGSLSGAQLRMAGADQYNTASHIKTYAERFEIVSLVGTVGAGARGAEPKCHLHLSLSDEAGRTLGGHVVGGCTVFTTAEIVLVELTELAFPRLHDEATGFPELSIQTRGDERRPLTAAAPR